MEGEGGYCESEDTMRRTGGVKSAPENHRWDACSACRMKAETGAAVGPPRPG